jgi:hypothetical protein
MRAALRRDVCSRDLFDLEPVHAPAGIARPPAVASFVITVITAEAGRIELGYRGGIFPEVEKWLQRLAGRDLTVLRKNAAHDLKHGKPPWFRTPRRCGTRASLQKFDSARVCDARRADRIRFLRYTITS